MSTTTTPRVSGAASGGRTARIGGSPAGGDTKRIAAAAAGGKTSRLSESASGGATSRIHYLLLLEGDESGYLLLEGDMQEGDDVLALSGDARDLTVSSTKRVALA
jgi:hypothetical protein